MCRDASLLPLSRPMPLSIKQQRGFLIPLALFIIVVLGYLALVITRTATQTSNSITQELLNTQTFYAAESGTQRGMQALFFPDASVRKDVDERCASMNQAISFTGITGLSHCSAQVTCSCRYNNNAACAPATAANYDITTSVTISFYTLNTLATCGQDNFRSERTIQAGAFLVQE